MPSLYGILRGWVEEVWREVDAERYQMDKECSDGVVSRTQAFKSEL